LSPQPGALAALGKAGQTPLEFLERHVHGDWGELDEEDRKENQLSLKRGFRLLSSYRTSSGDKTKVLGNHRSRPQRYDPTFARRVLNISNNLNQGKKEEER